MKRTPLALATTFAAAATLATLATPVVAADELALAQSKNCLACHAIDKKVVGPSYKDVAAKFAGQSGAVDMLAGKIMHGSSGTWGAVPMPPNTNVNEAEAKQLATWILSLK
jgi:cytochrome c